MKSLIAFWKQDIINKLIVIVLFALLVGVATIGWLIIKMQQGRTLKDAFVDFLPQTATPTFDVNAYLPTRTPAVITSTPFVLPSLTPPLPTETLLSPTPDLATSTPEPAETPSQFPPAQKACIPDNSPETGRVVEIIDGNTIKVLMDGKVYVVRYIGIKVPRDGETKEPFGSEATFANGRLVYGRDVILVKGISDKDERGRLLRYVTVGDIFVNLELIRQGYASITEKSTDSSCVEEFKQAEQTAISLHVGMWNSITTTPIP